MPMRNQEPLEEEAEPLEEEALEELLLPSFYVPAYSDEDLELLEQLDKPIKAWRPKTGTKVGSVEERSSLVGIVKQLSNATSDYGTYPLITLEVGAPYYVSIHAFHTVLANEIERLGLMEGDKLAVSYLGRTPEKRTMARYRVARKALPKSEVKAMSKEVEAF